MTDNEKLELKNFFTWEMMRFGVFASDAHTDYLVHATSIHLQRWKEAEARLKEAEELE